MRWINKWSRMMNTYPALLFLSAFTINIHILAQLWDLKVSHTKKYAGHMSSKWVYYLIFLGFLNSLIETKTLLNFHAKQNFTRIIFMWKSIFVLRNTFINCGQVICPSIGPQTEKRKKKNMHGIKRGYSDLYIPIDNVIKKLQT